MFQFISTRVGTLEMILEILKFIYNCATSTTNVCFKVFFLHKFNVELCVQLNVIKEHNKLTYFIERLDYTLNRELAIYFFNCMQMFFLHFIEYETTKSIRELQDPVSASCLSVDIGKLDLP